MRLILNIVSFAVLVPLLVAASLFAFSFKDMPLSADYRQHGRDEGFLIPHASLILHQNEEKEGRRVASLTKGWGYIHYRLDDKNMARPVPIFVPSRFVTDFASIPPVIRYFINPFGWHSEAAVLHDWLYAVGLEDERKTADEVFYMAMRQQGVNFFRRRLIYGAVRAFGEQGYKKPADWRFADTITGANLEECTPDRNKAADDLEYYYEWSRGNVRARLDGAITLDATDPQRSPGAETLLLGTAADNFGWSLLYSVSDCSTQIYEGFLSRLLSIIGMSLGVDSENEIQFDGMDFILPDDFYSEPVDEVFSDISSGGEIEANQLLTTAFTTHFVLVFLEFYMSDPEATLLPALKSHYVHIFCENRKQLEHFSKSHQSTDKLDYYLQSGRACPSE